LKVAKKGSFDACFVGSFSLGLDCGGAILGFVAPPTAGRFHFGFKGKLCKGKIGITRLVVLDPKKSGGFV